MALEAKIVLGDDLIISFDTEFIENYAEDAERQKKMNAEQIKLCDSLYAGEPVFDICKNNGWKYIIRYKER